MKKWVLSVLLLLALLVGLQGDALAQTYLFRVDQETVDIYLNANGTVDVEYLFVFSNNPGADPIDFVDVGLPTSSYRISDITAEVNGQPIRDIASSPYVDNGVALGLGGNAIQPGQTGTVYMYAPQIGRMFFEDSTDANYASVQFVNTWFDSKFVSGSTDLTVTFHLPPGVQSEEPRWHSAPSGFPSEPAAGFDEEGRIFYSWRNTDARGDRGYTFGASVPKSYIATGAISVPPQPGLAERVGIDPEAVIGSLFCAGVFGFIVLAVGISVTADRQRKLKYLPPKISIGGHGIKRGLTAVEAAILLEQSMDKILTMILFAVVKKGVATVISQDPLELEIVDPLPEEGLRAYEVHFLQAFQEKSKADQRRLLQDMMVKLVKSVARKMKGFSKRETVGYYRDVVKRAWSQVEAAETPEVRSEKYDKVMEWTMLDKDYDTRTQDVFRTGPVYVPIWWGRYNPGFGRTASAPRPTASVPSVSGRSAPSMPNIPGSSFAAGIVNSVQNFSASVVGNVADFTSGVTKVTNPPPPPSSRRSSGGGGSSCACACAGCACACACAGGGR